MIHNFRIKNKKAFTLIELLIVIAIIGILAGVVLVSTSSAREKARMSKALSAMRSIASITNTCTINGGSLNPPISNGNPGTAICNIGTELLPNISDTSFIYCGQSCGGWTSNGLTYAFSAYSDSYSGGRKIIVCGSDENRDGWYAGTHPGVSFNFTGITTCRSSGF